MLEGRRWGIYMDLPQQKPQQFNYIGAAYEAFFAGFCTQQLHLAARPFLWSLTKTPIYGLRASEVV